MHENFHSNTEQDRNELFWSLFDKQQFSSIEEVQETIQANNGSLEWMRESLKEPQWNDDERNNVLGHIKELEGETKTLQEKLDTFNRK